MSQTLVTGTTQKPDKKQSLYLITDKGREILENPPENWVSKPLEETPRGKPPEETLEKPSEEITVPSQDDLLKELNRINEQEAMSLLN